jgi:exonuclease SbcC
LPVSSLTLTAEEVAVAMEQQAQSRTARQRLTTLHARYQPLQKRLAQYGESVQKAQAEQAKLNDTSRCAGSNTRKNQHYQDVELLCRQEEKIKSLEAERAQLQAGHPCPLCGSTTHPAVTEYQALELSANQRRRDELAKEVAALKEEGLLVLGQVNALTQQIQRETARRKPYLRKSKHLLTSGKKCAAR